LPEGLQARTGEGGSWLSPGQWQCIALARAVLADNEIDVAATQKRPPVFLLPGR